MTKGSKSHTIAGMREEMKSKIVEHFDRRGIKIRSARKEGEIQCDHCVRVINRGSVYHNNIIVI